MVTVKGAVVCMSVAVDRVTVNGPSFFKVVGETVIVTPFVIAGEAVQ